LETSVIRPSTVLDKSRFVNLWKVASEHFQSSHCDDVFNELAELYTGDDRHYHGDMHINQCLAKMDEAKAEKGYHFTVEMAVWFHDAIYLPGDRENERNSATWFRQRTSNHFSTDTVNEVSEIITATEHREAPGGDRAKLMVDVDLSSFSLPTAEFLQDSRRIRQEFGALTTAEFIGVQSKFLRELLQRPSLYSTQYFLEHYESQARANIHMLLQMYESDESP